MVSLTIKDLAIRYENELILENFQLNVKNGEILVILGESGCGKSTLLKIIAGILPPEKGQLYLDDMEISNLSAQKREIGYVPQAQVLFPHLNVRNNISFGLKVRKFSKKEIHERILKIARLTELSPFLERFPNELSGGQQQRVALARAMVVEPRLLLLDEPLSSIDSFAREKLALMIRRINKILQTTVVYVTHSHEEAQMVGDRIAIIVDKTIIQTDSYRNICNFPKNYAVAKIMDIPNCWPVLAKKYNKDQKIYRIKSPIGIFTTSNYIKDEISGLRIDPSMITIQNFLEIDKVKTNSIEICNLDSKELKFLFHGVLIFNETLPAGFNKLIVQVGILDSYEFFKLRLKTQIFNSITLTNSNQTRKAEKEGIKKNGIVISFNRESFHFF